MFLNTSTLKRYNMVSTRIIQFNSTCFAEWYTIIVSLDQSPAARWHLAHDDIMLSCKYKQQKSSFVIRRFNTADHQGVKMCANCDDVRNPMQCVCKQKPHRIAHLPTLNAYTFECTSMKLEFVAYYRTLKAITIYKDIVALWVHMMHTYVCTYAMDDTNGANERLTFAAQFVMTFVFGDSCLEAVWIRYIIHSLCINVDRIYEVMHCKYDLNFVGNKIYYAI